MASTKDIVANELFILQETTPDPKNNWKKIRLVQWVIDGKPASIKLEKRGFYKTQDGDIRMGKAEGFSLADMELLKNIVDESKKESAFARIMALMRNPPAYKPAPEPAEPADSGDGQIEAIPF